MRLELEYCCTEAEKKEAQEIQMRHALGRGSKWRTRLVLLFYLALAIAALCFKLKQIATLNDRLLLLGILPVVFVALWILNRTREKKAAGTIRLELSDREVVLHTKAGRTVMLWSAFSDCIASPNLFVLVDRPKTYLLPVPKRAFPNEAAQNWILNQANQPRSVAPAEGDEALAPAGFVAGNGITLRLQLKYRDYLSRFISSWRFKGIAVFLLALMTVINFFSAPVPDAVNSPLKTEVIMVAMMIPTLAMVMLVVCFLSWRAEKKYLEPQQILLTHEGIEFTGRDSSGRMPWSSYKCFLENRWSFFVWQPGSTAWFMFPKREFASASDLTRFRDILQTNLKPSRWFYL